MNQTEAKEYIHKTKENKTTVLRAIEEGSTPCYKNKKTRRRNTYFHYYQE